jgi:hypothetical protein
MGTFFTISRPNLKNEILLHPKTHTMCSIAPSSSFVTPDTTPDKIANKPLADHSNDLRTVRNTNAKRRITFADDDDTEDDVSAPDPDPARQLRLDEKLLNLSAEVEADAHESALAFFNATANEFPESPEFPETVCKHELEIGEIPSFEADNTKSDEVTKSAEAPFDSPVLHSANSWREIDEDASDDEPCAKKLKAEHFVSCRNRERTYDGLGQCCPEMEHVHAADFDDSERRD